MDPELLLQNIADLRKQGYTDDQINRNLAKRFPDMPSIAAVEAAQPAQAEAAQPQAEPPRIMDEETSRIMDAAAQVDQRRSDAARMFWQGASLGTADEIAGFLRGMWPGGPTIPEAIEESRERVARIRAEDPVVAGTGEFSGGSSLAGLVGPLASRVPGTTGAREALQRPGITRAAARRGAEHGTAVGLEEGLMEFDRGGDAGDALAHGAKGLLWGGTLGGSSATAREIRDAVRRQRRGLGNELGDALARARGGELTRTEAHQMFADRRNAIWDGQRTPTRSQEARLAKVAEDEEAYDLGLNMRPRYESDVTLAMEDMSPTAQKYFKDGVAHDAARKLKRNVSEVRSMIDNRKQDEFKRFYRSLFDSDAQYHQFMRDLDEAAIAVSTASRIQALGQAAAFLFGGSSIVYNVIAG